MQVLWKSDHLHRDCSGGRIFGMCFFFFFLLMIQDKWVQSLSSFSVPTVFLLPQLWFTINEHCLPLCFMHSFPEVYIFFTISCLLSFPQFNFVILVTLFSLFCLPSPRGVNEPNDSHLNHPAGINMYLFRVPKKRPVQRPKMLWSFMGLWSLNM